MQELGVHSEVGKPRKVMMHRPDLSLKRLTPFEPMVVGAVIAIVGLGAGWLSI